MTAASAPRLRAAAVIGTGMIGTSVALALRAAGVAVHLFDADPTAARTAEALAAGTLAEPDAPVDIAVIAVPPAHVAKVLLAAQTRGLAAAYTDTASVKASPQREAEEAGCDAASYVGGHPIAGRERTGPMAARVELFEERPWVLTPTAATRPEAVEAARAVALACGARPVVMDAAAHDRAMALVSHLPQLLASLMAARLEGAEERTAGLAGQGLRDVTRLGASDPGLWTDILAANATAVSAVLEDFAADLADVADALKALGAGRGGAERITGALRRGNAGHARIPGKHGAPPAEYTPLAVVVGDHPGELARLFADAARVGANIEDVRIEHAPSQPQGVVELLVTPETARWLADELVELGWTVQS